MAVHDDQSISSRTKVQKDVAIAFLVLSWSFIGLRVWTRTYVITNFGWDDATMLIAGYCATMLYLEANGGGTHITSVAQIFHLTKWAIVGQATYIVTIMMLKTSVAIFFARIVIKPWQLWTIYITTGVNIISSAAAFFYALLRCGPDLDNYAFRQLQNKCMPRSVDRFFAFEQAAFTTITDCTFAILPVFILWNAHMSIRNKISVGLILSLAGAGSVCSMVRFRYVDGLTEVEDFFWSATNIAIWSTIEPGAGIIAACLATLRPCVVHFVSHAKSLTSTRTSTSRSTKTASRSSESTDKPHSAKYNNPLHSITSQYEGRLDIETGPQRNEGQIEMNTCLGRERDTGSTEHILARVDSRDSWFSEDMSRLKPAARINAQTTMTGTTIVPDRGRSGDMV
ncbi:hypothetical protein M011DRAFT_513691 [Sporormia fimetaria CBS 119925]|uniref:Rhodopsin domain-containing protein n=1 Tax=Sporormia fimetaria CBS 119925 TaxID=1340428 RepID=A0A6A6VID6_9PLEO|nr:hypothetical protein M011DRAFT_513691 [Sporormia fimetaria CBS 119925]